MNSATVSNFIERELAKWPLAAANYEALKQVETKTINIDRLPVKVQYNPARRVSTGAKVDKASISRRPCFLCAANRPAEQESLHWGAHYEVLVNPFPIFRRHLTIPDMRHVAQTSKGRGPQMVEIARDLEDYAVFYNGPQCGASAPDHMHFQACPKGELPLIAAVDKYMPAVTKTVELQASFGFPFGFFVMDIHNKLKPEMATETVHSLYAVLDPSTDEADYMSHEPRLNLICYTSGDTSRVIIIPRRAHRPSFYGDGPGQMLISPASVDLGGVLITPRKEDFDRITADDIRRVYAECCYSEDKLIEIIDRI